MLHLFLSTFGFDLCYLIGSLAYLTNLEKCTPDCQTFNEKAANRICRLLISTFQFQCPK